MKIFQVITVSEYGGAQSVVANLSGELSKIPANSLYVLSGGEGEAWGDLDSHIIKIRIDKHRKQISLKDILLFFKLIYYRFKYNPDIVHLHSSKMGILGRLAFSKKKTVLTMHGFDSVRKVFRKYLVLERALHERAARIVAVSQYDVEGMAEEGITGNVSLVYNGIPDRTQEKREMDVEFESVLQGLKHQYDKVIMCISRISQQKKFDLFVDIALSMPQYAFVWIGNKEPVTGLPENAYCLGEAHAAHQYLAFADVFILPTNYEGMPISIIEALSYGKPVVASAVGGLPEILNGENGYAVENTVSAFQEAIDMTIENENIYSSMSQKARQTYLEHFTIDKMLAGYKTIYEQIYKNNNKQK